MNIIDLSYIKDIISRSDLELIIPKPFTTEEKFIAIEKILSNYKELQPKVSELRQRFIDEEFSKSKESTDVDFKDLVDDLNIYIDVVNSYTDDEIILLVMEETWRKREIDDFIELNKLGKHNEKLVAEARNGNTGNSLKTLSVEISNNYQKALEKSKEYHVDEILCFYIKETLQKIRWPEAGY